MTVDHRSVIVGRQIYTRRIACGWSARQLSERLESAEPPISRRTISKVENGTRGVTLDELAALAGMFGMTDPWELTKPLPECVTCSGCPPRGYRCLACGCESIEGSAA